MTAAALRTGPAQHDDPLAPLRAALLDRARRDAAQVLGAADAAAATIIASATAEADRIHARAATETAADAAAIVAAQRTRARRRARAVVLRAHRTAYDDLRRASRDAVRRLRDEPGYATLQTGLAEAARRRLGPDAVIGDDPDGGIVAEAGDRRIEFRLTALAERMLTELLTTRADA